MDVQYGQTPLTLWETITGRREPFKGNERTQAGKELEPIILKWGLEKLYCDDKIKQDYSSFIVSRLMDCWTHLYYYSFTECAHPNRPYLKTHADLICSKKETPFIMEAKSAGFFGAKRENDINIGYDKDDTSANGIPSSVYLQIQTQMLCYNIPIAYVSVMIDTGLHRLYGPIPAHKSTQEKILAIAEKFWWYVEKEKPPKPSTWADVVILNPVLSKDSKTVIGGQEEEKVIEMKDRAKELRKKEKKIKAELDDIKNAIGLLLGGNAILESSNGNKLATAFETIRENLNLKELKENDPEKYKDLTGYLNKTTSRQVRY
jgi:hypothetical protein